MMGALGMAAALILDTHASYQISGREIHVMRYVEMVCTMVMAIGTI
jgi:hypothetical protein